MQLLSKTQYRDFEPGEFTEEATRTCEDTLLLIDSLPWGDQREKTAISLTNPSVTIEGPNNDYLKLAIYYNGKYVLHYFDLHKQLYTRSFDNYKDAYPIINTLYTAQPFNPEGFHHETTWLQHNITHFRSADFTYTMNDIAVLGVSALAIIATLGLLGVSLTALLSEAPIPARLTFLLLIAIVLFLAIGVMPLFINHYKNSVDKVLILSSGKDFFYYGAGQTPDKYDKTKILDIVTYGERGRYGYNRLTRIEINFRDGSSIDISCLILRQEQIVAKFPKNTRRQIKTILPFIPLSASVPS